MDPTCGGHGQTPTEYKSLECFEIHVVQDHENDIQSYRNKPAMAFSYRVSEVEREIERSLLVA